MNYEPLYKPWLPGGGGGGHPYVRDGDARRHAPGV